MIQDAILRELAKDGLTGTFPLSRTTLLEAATEALLRTERFPRREALRLTSPRALAVVTLMGAFACTRGLLSLLGCFRPDLAFLGLLPLGAVVPALGALLLLRSEKTQIVDARSRTLVTSLLARRVSPELALRTTAAVTQQDEQALRAALGLGGDEIVDARRIIEGSSPTHGRGGHSTRAQFLCVVAVAWCSISFWSLYCWSMLGGGLDP